MVCFQKSKAHKQNVLLPFENGHHGFTKQKIGQKTARKANHHGREPTAEGMSARECGTVWAKIVTNSQTHLLDCQQFLIRKVPDQNVMCRIKIRVLSQPLHRMACAQQNFLVHAQTAWPPHFGCFKIGGLTTKRQKCNSNKIFLFWIGKKFGNVNKKQWQCLFVCNLYGLIDGGNDVVHRNVA